MSNANYPLKIKVLMSLVLDEGDNKGPFFPLSEALTTFTNDNKNFKRYTEGDYLKVDMTTMTALLKQRLTLDKVFSIAENGGDVEGYAAMLELDDPDVAVPADFASRTYIDDQGVEQVHTFRTYTKAGSDYPIQIGSKHYIALDNLIVEPPFSHLVSIKSSVISIDDYKAL